MPTASDGGSPRIGLTGTHKQSHTHGPNSVIRRSKATRVPISNLESHPLIGKDEVPGSNPGVGSSSPKLKRNRIHHPANAT
jgi:hypothetical protein